jgi:glycosyltransferase involved in cell wall biosynthesis
MSPAVFRTAKKHGAATIATLHSFRYSCIKAVCNRDGQVCEDCIGSRLKLAGVRHRCYHDSFAASAAITLSLVTHHGRTFGECVDRFAALSDYAREVAVRDGLPAAKVVVKPNFVPDPHPDLDPVGESVLFMGRLVPEKGIAHLLDAWVRFRDTLPALVIAGDGAMRSAVEDAIAAGANIDFLGWVEESDLEAHIAKCRIVVVTSLWQESAPMVLLRSLAAARPAVVPALSNFNGPAVALKAAATYTPGDAASLAATVIAMYDAAEHLSLRETARNTYLSTYSPSIIFDSLVQIYRDALAH